MDVFHSNSKKDKKIFIEYYIDNNKYISAISCDVIHRIHKNLLINNLGSVSNDIVNAIIKCNGNIAPNTQYIKLYNKSEDFNNNMNNEKNNIQINDKKQMLNMLSNIYQDTSITRKITESTSKKIYIWKERIIGFLFGVLSSFLASVMYENRFIITTFLYDKINEILKYITNLSK